MKILKVGPNGVVENKTIGENFTDLKHANQSAIVESIEEDIESSIIVDEFISGDEGVILDAVDNVVNNMQSATKDFGKFLEGGYVTRNYYQLNKADSMIGSAGESQAIYGPESPRKYTRIDRFPLFSYTITKEDADTQLNEYVYSMTAYILPASIKPSIDELIIGSVGDKNVIFKVSNIESSRGVNKVFQITAISIKEATLDELELLNMSVEDKKFFILKHINTSKRLIMSETDIELSASILKVRTSLVSSLVDLMYQGSINTFIETNEDKTVTYNKYLNYFLYSNRLLDDTAYDNINPAFYLVKDEYEFNKEYKQMPYEAFVNGNSQYMSILSLYLDSPPADSFNTQFLLYAKSKIYNASVMDDPQMINTEYLIMPTSIIEKIKKNEQYTDDELTMIGAPNSPKRVVYEACLKYYTAIVSDNMGVSYTPFIDMDYISNLNRIPFDLMDRDQFVKLVPFLLKILKHEEDFINSSL